MAAGCAVQGGCPTDYIAISLSIISFILLLTRSTLPYLLHRVPRPKGSSFWIPAIQVFASFNLLLSFVMSLNYLKFRKRHWWQSCYFWTVWIEGPLGFGLLLSCRISQARHLYYVFVKRRLPPIRSYIFLPLIILPWITSAAGIWLISYVLNDIHEEITWLEVTSRFLLLTTASILVLAFFSVSSSQPLVSLISMRKMEGQEPKTMGRALGIHDSGLLFQTEQDPVVDPSVPLDKLLLNKRFHQSFMAFADSCLAGESLHFYDEVQLLDKIPVSDPVRRIYMARHIIEKYINAGATMEVNISHRCRQEILTTLDLTHRDLFKNALSELMQLMKMNLAKDYWSSMFFLKFKEDASLRTVGHELEPVTGWNFSPRLSSVHCADDPFHQEHLPNDNHDSNLQ